MQYLTGGGPSDEDDTRPRPDTTGVREVEGIVNDLDSVVGSAESEVAG